jgi:hypothetical protein
VNVGYHLAARRGRLARMIYGSALGRIARPIAASGETLDLDVVAFSGKAVLPEQVASIRSFFRHIGAPARFLVFSDGTYDASDIAMIERIHQSLEVAQVPAPEPGSALEAYAGAHPLGKKLAALSSLASDRATLYVDSDVLFFARARELRDLASKGHWYLPDCEQAFEPKLLDDGEARLDPVNSGLAVIAPGFDWTIALNRLGRLEQSASFYAEQTVMHVAMHANAASALDRELYVVSRADDFRFTDGFPEERIAARHYVAPVRYRLWAGRGLWRDAIRG